MTTIEVRGVAYVRDLFGKKHFSYSFEGVKTVYQILDDLDAAYGLGNIIYDADRKIVDSIRIILNGRDAKFLPPEQLYLKESDIVLILPTLAGG